MAVFLCFDRCRLLLIASCFVLPFDFAVAGGIYFPYLGARATGMGSAAVALADDASTVFHNPAGMTRLKSAEATVNLHLNLADFRYTRVDGPVEFEPVSLDGRLNPQPYLGYVVNQEREKYALGIAAFAAWGGLPDWPDDGPQRYQTDYFRLAIVHFSLAGAYQVTDSLSFGAAGSLIYGSIGQRKSVDARDLLGFPDLIQPGVDDPSNEIITTIDASDWAFGGHFGVLWDLNDQIRFGAYYSLPVTISFSGSIIGDVREIELFRLLLGDEFDAETRVGLTLPQVIRAGFSFRVSPKLLLAIDGTFQDWSAVTENVVSISGLPGLDEIVIPRNWQDSWSAAAGVEYALSEKTQVRFGGLFDKGAIPTSTVLVDDPDSDKWAITAGSSFGFGDRTSLDLSLEYRIYEDLDVRDSAYANPDLEPGVVGGNSNGLYESSILSLSVGVRFRLADRRY